MPWKCQLRSISGHDLGEGCVVNSQPSQIASPNKKLVAILNQVEISTFSVRQLITKMRLLKKDIQAVNIYSCPSP